MKWISAKERLPKLTESDWLGRKSRRVYFVVRGQVLAGYARENSLGSPWIMFWPSEHGPHYFPEEVSHWAANPFPDPPKEQHQPAERTHHDL